MHLLERLSPTNNNEISDFEFIIDGSFNNTNREISLDISEDKSPIIR